MDFSAILALFEGWLPDYTVHHLSHPGLYHNPEHTLWNMTDPIRVFDVNQSRQSLTTITSTFAHKNRGVHLLEHVH